MKEWYTISALEYAGLVVLIEHLLYVVKSFVESMVAGASETDYIEKQRKNEIHIKEYEIKKSIKVGMKDK